MIPSSSRISLIVGLAFSLAAAAGPGLAQGQYGPPPGPPGPNGAPPPQTPASQAQRLRDTLRLRSDQEGALQAFIAAVTPPAGAMERMHQEEQTAASQPTPQRLDYMVRRMEEMRTLMISQIGATRRFYAQLTPLQQRAFDAMPSGAGRGR
jgi:periplasmic protein CpxP/Spy